MATKKKPAAKAKKAAPKAKAKIKAKAPVKAKAKVTAKAKAGPKSSVAKAKSPAKKVTPKKAAPKKPAPKKTALKKASPKKTAPKKQVTTKKAVNKIKAATKPSPKAATKVAPKKSAPQKPLSIAKAAKAKPDTHLQVGDFVPYKMKRGEQYMNEAQREHFKNILRNWRNELMEEVDRTVHHMQDEAANPPDPADRATLEEEFSIELRTRDRERRLIKKIDSTIELIVKDDYGYCDSCGIEIGIRRLEARPTANKCIDCKTLDEIKEKQLGA